MTGFFSFARATARQIMSLASAEPPGLFTRSTIALMSSSLRALSIALTIVSEPMDEMLPDQSYWLLPLVMAPVQ